MLSVSPLAAPASGNLTVLVTGERFDDYGDVQCRFGPVAVPGIFHHRGAITCVAPPVYALCRWAGLPVGVHARRGNYGRVAKRYGALSADGLSWDATATSADDCKTPVTLPARHTVEVSFNGVDFTKGSVVEFGWYDSSLVALSGIHPRAGPMHGGTLVTITGRHLTDFGGRVTGSKCQFGATFGSPVVNATVDESSLTSTLLCLTPPLPVHQMSLDSSSWERGVFVTLSAYADARTLFGRNASANASDLDGPGSPHGVGGDGAIGGNGEGRGEGSVALITFRYDSAAPTLTRVHPLGGPVVGGSNVVLSAAKRLYDDGGTLCLFGESPFVQISARVDEMGRVSCVVPPLVDLMGRGARPPGPWCAGFSGETQPCRDDAYAADGAMAVALDVTFNGNVSDATGRPVPWLFFGVEPELQLHYSRPRGANGQGGAVVQVVGRGLLDYGGVLCHFAMPDFRMSKPVKATLAGGVDEDAMTSAPLLTRTVLHDGRTVRSLNSQAARMIRCVAPPLTPRYSATNYTEAEQAELHQSDPRTMPPPEGSRPDPFVLTTLSVSLDDGQHFAPGFDFVYANPVPSSVWPHGGPRSGGTPVTVSGSGFKALGDESPSFINGEAASITRGSPTGLHGIRERPPTLSDQIYAESGRGVGATMKHVRGGGSAGVFCSFEGVGIVKGTVRGSFDLLCVSPPVTNRSSYNSAVQRSATGLPATRVRVLLHGYGGYGGEVDTGGFSSTFALFYYTPESLGVTSISPAVGPALGGTMVTIFGSALAHLGQPLCRFGRALPEVSAILLGRSANGSVGVLTHNQSVALSPGEYVEAIACRSPANAALREAAASRNCKCSDTRCGSEESVALEISLNGAELTIISGAAPLSAGAARAGDFFDSRLEFTYVAYFLEEEPNLPNKPLPPPPPFEPPPSPPPPQPMNCMLCDAGTVCGICLVLIPPEECPPRPELSETMKRCDESVALQQLCEGDGECGTHIDANNCNPGGYDVYRRVLCTPIDSAVPSAYPSSFSLVAQPGPGTAGPYDPREVPVTLIYQDEEP